MHRENLRRSLPFTAVPALSPQPSFDDVFATHVDYVWRVLRCLGVPARDLEDVAQDVFVVVHRKLPSWEARADMRSWLYAIAHRVAKDHRRLAWNRRSVPLGDDHEEEGAAGPEDAALARRALEEVADVLAQLDEEQRMVFVLYELEGLTMESIAEAMQCPVKTAYSRLRLARERLHAAREVSRDRA